METLTMIMMFAIVFAVLFLLETLLLILIAKKTNAMTEFKASMKKCPVSEFYDDTGYVELKAIKPDCGLIEDKEKGTFTINETGTYIDRKTKLVRIPFDTGVGTSVNIQAANLAHSFSEILKDERELLALKEAIINNQIPFDEVNVLKQSVKLSSIRGMLTAMLPHNTESKIQKMLAQRMKGYGKVNVWQIVLIFVAILGAILIGYLIIKSMGGSGTTVVNMYNASASALQGTVIG